MSESTMMGGSIEGSTSQGGQGEQGQSQGQQGQEQGSGHGQGQGQEQTQAQGQVGASWLDAFDGVDADIKGDPSLKAIKDVPNLIKSYVNAQKMIGADKAVLPTKNSSQEEVAAFYAKMGLPEFDQYALNKPEDTKLDDTFLDGFKKAAHEANILPSQADKMFEYISQKTNNDMATIESESANKIAEATESLKEEWKNDFDLRLHQAKMAVAEFGGDELKAYLNESGLGNDPKLIRAFQKIGETLIKEDSFQGNYKQAFGMSSDDAEKQIGKITGDMQGAYYNANHADHRRVVDEVNKLYERLAAK